MSPSLYPNAIINLVILVYVLLTIVISFFFLALLFVVVVVFFLFDCIELLCKMPTTFGSSNEFLLLLFPENDGQRLNLYCSSGETKHG